ncbi:MAG TPA: hypothetical protein VFG50_14110 [Rhodothermales bacterium]|nr:hypothetical protein [Rhodothermales bacterium]
MKINVPGNQAQGEVLVATLRTYALLRSIVFTTGALLKQTGMDGDGIVRTVLDFEQKFFEESLSKVLGDNPEMPEELRKQIEEALGRPPGGEGQAGGATSGGEE